MKEPDVVITIPTMNSGRFIGRCLDAIGNQTYKHVDVNIIDGGSCDETVNIARAHGVERILTYRGGLLGARELGTKIAQGPIVVLLDSDQILEPDAIERAVAMMRDNDMLVLEEDVYSNRTLIEKLFHCDRVLVHSIKDFSPYTGAMLPRVYNRQILLRAFSAMPSEILERIGGQDHAIIYYEAWKISQRTQLVTSAVKHIEPANLMSLWQKFYRWGYTSKDAHLGAYKDLISKKERFRTGMFTSGLLTVSVGSAALLIMKGIPYVAGLTAARLGVGGRA